jgi:hypothetical protein
MLLNYVQPSRTFVSIVTCMNCGKVDHESMVCQTWKHAIFHPSPMWVSCEPPSSCFDLCSASNLYFATFNDLVMPDEFTIDGMTSILHIPRTDGSVSSALLGEDCETGPLLMLEGVLSITLEWGAVDRESRFCKTVSVRSFIDFNPCVKGFIYKLNDVPTGFGNLSQSMKEEMMRFGDFIIR